MSCISCQNKIEKRLKREKGVRTAEVNYAAKTADITYDADEISLAGIKKIIEETGYEVRFRSDNNKFDFERMAGFLLVIFSLYALLQMTGILNLLVPGQLAETGMGYGMLFVIGLLTSVHRVAMCGGINLSKCLPDQGRKTEKKHMLRPAFLYNLGRVCSYTAVGFVLGTVGMLIGGGGSTGLPVVFQGMLKIIVRYPQKVFTREELIAAAFDDAFDGYDRVIDTHIKNLRKKIETDPKKLVYIRTVHGIGYGFGGNEP